MAVELTADEDVMAALDVLDNPGAYPVADVLPVTPTFQGECGGCGAKIPEGYLAYVTKWVPVVWGKEFKVDKPARMFCRDCKNLA